MSSSIPVDIQKRIEDDFGKRNANNIAQLLCNKIGGLGNGTRDRHLRCVLYLSKGNRKKLDQYITACLTDPRDVMLWAEYDEDMERKRDFNKPFGSETCVAESSSTKTTRTAPPRKGCVAVKKEDVNKRSDPTENSQNQAPTLNQTVDAPPAQQPFDVEGFVDEFDGNVEDDHWISKQILARFRWVTIGVVCLVWVAAIIVESIFSLPGRWFVWCFVIATTLVTSLCNFLILCLRHPEANDPTNVFNEIPLACYILRSVATVGNSIVVAAFHVEFMYIYFFMEYRAVWAIGTIILFFIFVMNLSSTFLPNVKGYVYMTNLSLNLFADHTFGFICCSCLMVLLVWGIALGTGANYFVEDGFFGIWVALLVLSGLYIISWSYCPFHDERNDKEWTLLKIVPLLTFQSNCLGWAALSMLLLYPAVYQKYLWVCSPCVPGSPYVRCHYEYPSAYNHQYEYPDINKDDWTIWVIGTIILFLASCWNLTILRNASIYNPLVYYND